MKVLDVKKFGEEDNNFGKEVQFQIFKFEKKSFFQFSISWSDDPNPLYIVISGFKFSLFLTLLFNKLGLEVEILGENWHNKGPVGGEDDLETGSEPGHRTVE
jgi:hypothetical protein